LKLEIFEVIKRSYLKDFFQTIFLSIFLFLKTEAVANILHILFSKIRKKIRKKWIPLER